MKLDPYLTSFTKINSKWVRDINITPDVIKLPEENTGRKLINISLTNYFGGTMPKEQTKEKVNNGTTLNLKGPVKRKKQFTK